MSFELIQYPKGFIDRKGRDLSECYALLLDGNPELLFNTLEEVYEFQEQAKEAVLSDAQKYEIEQILDHRSYYAS